MLVEGGKIRNINGRTKLLTRRIIGEGIDVYHQISLETGAVFGRTVEYEMLSRNTT